MSRYILVFLTALLVFSCSKNSTEYTLSGTADGYGNDTEIFVYRLDNNQPIVIDTLAVEQGKFVATYPKTDDLALHFMRVGQNGYSILFFPENEDLKATIYKDSLQSSYVTGGQQNESYRAYTSKQKDLAKKRESLRGELLVARQEQDNLLATTKQNEITALDAEETSFNKAFITENNNSIFSLMLAQELFNKNQLTGAEAKTIAENLSPKIATLGQAKALIASIEAKTRAEIGSKAPEFSAQTPEGKELSLNETLGKYTIIDFWASWCRPCRMENPNVVRVYEKYHDKGLNIISVSLDKATQKERWIKAIADDNMDWYHVSNLKFWQDPIAKQYNVRSIPATFLLDADGNIIDKNLRGQALENKIASLLGQ